MALANQTKRFLRSAVTSPAAAAELIEDLEKIDAAPTLTNAVRGVEGNVLLAGGVIALDGSNPTPVITGMDTVNVASVSYEKATAPADDPSWLTVSISGGTINIYAWKNTGGTDPTLVASTDTGNVHWIALGS